MASGEFARFARDAAFLDNQLIAKGLVADTRSRALNMLKSILDWAVLSELIAANPVTSYKVQRESAVLTQDRQQRVTLNEDQTRRFLTAVRDKPLYAAIYILFTLGLRRGEALGLRWKDVGRKERLVSVTQQVSVCRNQPTIGLLKTASSRRVSGQRRDPHDFG